MGDPGYEAGARSAEFLGAKVHRVPLRKDYAHDVKAMIKADPNAGVYYICNPNNPTGTLTPMEDIEWIVANKPGRLHSAAGRSLHPLLWGEQRFEACCGG